MSLLSWPWSPFSPAGCRRAAPARLIPSPRCDRNRAPADPATGAIKGTTIQEQTRQCLTNIQAILEEAGSSLDKLVSVTVVLSNQSMKPTAPLRNASRVFATAPCRGLSLSR
ncbi:MAG: Rid family hydrolase [Pseudolabrys sp.]